MYSTERRFEYGNSKHLTVEAAHNLCLDPEALAQYLWTNRERYNSISEIDSYDSEDEFLANHTELLDELTDRIFDLTSLIDENELITLYRGVELGPDDVSPDLERPGMCWTYDYNVAERFVQQFDEGTDADYAPCILEAKFKAKDIDWIYSIACMLDEPDEKEIRTYRNTKPVKIEYEVL